MARLNLIGQKYNKLTVLELILPIKTRTSWKCKCDCGEITNVIGSRLINGTTASCGCISGGPGVKRPHLWKPAGAVGFRRVVNTYKSNAKRKGYVFALTTDNLQNLFSGNCHYCGDPPKREIKHKTIKSPFVYNGIDRLDNSIGYIYDNCVSCCTDCNLKKRNQNYDVFLRWINKVYEKLNEPE